VRERVADHEVTGVLGAGADGMAYLAVPAGRLRVGGDPVVVTVLSGPADDDAYGRVNAVLATAGALGPPHLARLHEVGRDEGAVFHVREHLPLGSLAAPVVALDRAKVLLAVAGAARAVHALHEAGLAHRGIAPGAVLLHPDGIRLGPPRLLHLLAAGRTLTAAAAAGVVEFVDPALLRGERGGRRSDIWSLGAVLHRGLTGSGIYGELPPDPVPCVRRVLTTPPVLHSGLSPAEAEVVRACLEPDPGARLATAAELADRIDALGGPS